MHADFMSIADANVIVNDREIIYMTRDWEYIPQLYPKQWPYAKHLIPSSRSLEIDVDSLPKHELAGNIFMPFTMAGNWFHVLFDNYARLYFLGQLPANEPLRVGVPFWGYPAQSAVPSDRAVVHAAFMHGQNTVRLEKGIYKIERLIAPPLADADDYFCAEPTRFVADCLGHMLKHKVVHHPLRLFVSRADIGVRNLANEAELTAELRRLGFTIVCPGDFSFCTQLELFNAAEFVVGVHGQGLSAMICARHCRGLMEFEAADWAYTAYRSLAKVLGIPYKKLPCELIGIRNPLRFDWLARVEVGACIAEVERALEDNERTVSPAEGEILPQDNSSKPSGTHFLA